MEDYRHAQEVFSTFQMKSMGAYHDLYLKTDVLLLSNVFETFQNVCMKQYEPDPCHFYTSPGLAWTSCLKMTGVDQILMTESGIRGGISQISIRYKEANNEFLETYDTSKPRSFLAYVDANNLYGWAMVQALPVGNFEFLPASDVDDLDILSIPEDSETGYILEVLLEYDVPLHQHHHDPLAQEAKYIHDDQLSPYTQNLLRKLHGLDDADPLPSRGNVNVV